MSRAIMGREIAALTTAFLRDGAIGYGQPTPQTTYFSVDGSTSPGERTTYTIVVPHGRLREFFSGIGGSEEAVVVTVWPNGTAELVASTKALNHISKEIRKGQQAIRRATA